MISYLIPYGVLTLFPKRLCRVVTFCSITPCCQTEPAISQRGAEHRAGLLAAAPEPKAAAGALQVEEGLRCPRFLLPALALCVLEVCLDRRPTLSKSS